ncbi:IS110 family transposase [Vibrio parahaemolyticus]|uniref:IS110 family transposase n=1 Tax=Vibrio parahaemolyticus TaxID=670 RepID=UPI00040D5663|nr:IS110 family transposase [Vibrio parahaemolyticus]EGQ9819065.1 IS110 family transposase [Vibrio parahaemolyticus]EJL6383414.1 IS110 family transposase [Vibrio parahaemolyticus]TBT71802.1 IS110 family transposase [Vibrio parahaemolyticus]TOB36859.1 IS110 family transposase [Vibrio parahaemolyticus]TOC10765.1 IS110 family transposase [Vibrio parahaemolyticus]
MSSSNVHIYGIDLGKNWFHIVAMDRQGHILWRKKFNRSQLKTFVVNTPPTIVAVEACPGSQYWGRLFNDAGFSVKIIPAQFVKPYLKSNKNDFNDAAAIAEAGNRGTMRCVALKTHEQLALQATHRVRQRFIVERTATVNQMRALLLEYGITVPVGRKVFERNLPSILEDAENGLPDFIRALVFRLRERWQHIDVQIDEMSAQLQQASIASEKCQLISSVPGIGPIVATGLIAAVGSGTQFKRGRDMSAWLGLVPRQYSTGGRSNLGGISKRGNVYLRRQVIQGAKALKIHMKRDKSALGQWIAKLEATHHHHVVLIALANKIMRICWKILTSGQAYQPYPASAAK